MLLLLSLVPLAHWQRQLHAKPPINREATRNELCDVANVFLASITVLYFEQCYPLLLCVIDCPLIVGNSGWSTQKVSLATHVLDEPLMPIPPLHITTNHLAAL